MARLNEFYKDTVIKELTEKFSYKTPMQVPRVLKITLNMGVGAAISDKKVMEHALGDMEKIAGQKPIVTVAKKSIATWKIRDDYPVGCKVTLRKSNMYTFLDRLITVAIPRERDFRGLSPKSFDGRGNYNMGITEQIIFPEIQYDKIDVLRGMNITITTNAKTDEEAKALLAAFSFPFIEKSTEEAPVTVEEAPVTVEEAPASDTAPAKENQQEDK
jgi:large subunit ribosomal protein L5